MRISTAPCQATSAAVARIQRFALPPAPSHARRPDLLPFALAARLLAPGPLAKGKRMPVRIVTTHLEFEGQVYEQRVVLEGDEPPVWGPDAELSVVGTATPRVDGRERVSGAATYSHDVRLPGQLFAAGLRSPHAHARVV